MTKTQEMEQNLTAQIRAALTQEDAGNGVARIDNWVQEHREERGGALCYGFVWYHRPFVRYRRDEMGSQIDRFDDYVIGSAYRNEAEYSEDAVLIAYNRCLNELPRLISSLQDKS